VQSGQLQKKNTIDVKRAFAWDGSGRHARAGVWKANMFRLGNSKQKTGKTASSVIACTCMDADRSLSYFPLGPCSKPALLTIKDCLQREVVLGETCRESIAKHADVEGFRSAHERDICALKRSHGVEPCFFVNGTVLPLIKDFHNVVCTCRAGQQKPG
jgi:hypothetical protein